MIEEKKLEKNVKLKEEFIDKKKEAEN
jgi:hypothetical protein